MSQKDANGNRLYDLDRVANGPEGRARGIVYEFRGDWAYVTWFGSHELRRVPAYTLHRLGPACFRAGRSSHP